MQRIESYPLLKDLYLEMVQANGGINRDRSEEQALRASDPVIGAEGVYHRDLQAMEDFLATLTEEERSTIADGEHEEAQAILARDSIGSHLDGLMNDLFEA